MSGVMTEVLCITFMIILDLIFNQVFLFRVIKFVIVAVTHVDKGLSKGVREVNVLVCWYVSETDPIDLPYQLFSCQM